MQYPYLYLLIMSKHTIRGKFFVNGNKCYYPSQKEIAEGWRIVLPKRNMVVKSTEESKDKEGNVVQKHTKVNKELYAEVTLAQLPPHLYSHFFRIGDDVKETIIFDNFYKFRVIKTQHDDMIQELYKLVLVRYPTVNQMKKMSELVEVLEANNISGWLLIRAKEKSS